MSKENYNNIFYNIFHLRNKAHLSNNQATRLAFKSNFISNTFMGSFMASDAMSKEELAKQGRSQAIEERDSATLELVQSREVLIEKQAALDNVNQNLIQLESKFNQLNSVLGGFVDRPDADDSEISIIITASQAKTISEEPAKTTIMKIMGLVVEPPE